MLSGRGDPIGVGYARFGVVEMRSRDARWGSWFLEPKAKSKPQQLGFSKQDVGVLCFGYKEPGGAVEVH